MMQTMQIRLTRELINEIKILVDLGIYPNVSECVRDAVRMLVTTKENPKGFIPPARAEEVKAIQEKVQEEVKEQIKEQVKPIEKFQNPSGTVDFYPEELEIRNKIFNSLRKTAGNFGFSEVESPAFEYMNVLTKKSGDEVASQIFVLEQKGDEKFGLRFDLTVPITRMFLEKQKQIPKPVKWYGLSRMWRYERPQAGRLREFYQLSVELFGSNKPEADAEIINLAINCLVNLGLTSDDFYVRINNRKLLQGILEEYAPKENMEKLIALVDKKSKIPKEEFERGLKDFGVKDIEGLKDILETDNLDDLKLSNELAKKGLEELKSVTKLISKDYLWLDLTTARGLAYYTGTVFEIFDRQNKFRAIAGGGRYDEMVKLFGGEDCPATGFGMGYSTLSLLLKEKNLLPKPELGVDYFIVIINDSVKEKAIEIANKMRKKFRVDIDLMQRNIGNQFKYANTIKAKKVVIVGPDELKQNKVKVKDMGSGKEELIEINSL
jgi:histidyl-tRNA synthetase